MSHSIQKRLADVAEAGGLVGLLFDHLMSQPVKMVVDADVVLTQLDRTLDERLTERGVTAHLKPFLERERARSSVRKDRLGDWVSPELQAELRAMSMRPVKLDREFLKAVVQQGSVKHMVRSIVEEALDRFVSTLKPGGSGGGLIGSVGRGAFGFASRASKGILGQIGSQVEGQLQSAVSSFVQSSTSVMLDRLIVILTSPETAQHLGRSGAAAHDALIKYPTEDAWAFMERVVPVDDLLDCLPGQLSFPMARDDIRDGMTGN